MKLSEAKNNDIVYISKILGYGSFRKRITEMGFVRGKEVRIVKNTPFNGPIEVKILNYNITLRKSEAELIEIHPVAESDLAIYYPSKEVTDPFQKSKSLKERGNTINIALAGNPNSGKTSLYNCLSGAKERIGNYGGVTVEIAKTSFRADPYLFNIYDLPGTYSLSTWAQEEVMVRKFIYEEAPDIILNVVDAANLERNLFLTTQLIDMDLRVVIALNMYDEIGRKQTEIDYKKLSELLGIPVIPVVSTKGTGIEELISRIQHVFEGESEFSRHIHINYGKNLESAIAAIRKKLNDFQLVTDKISARFLALKLLENDNQVNELLSQYEGFDELKKTAEKEIRRIQDLENEDIISIIADARYGFINGALRETVLRPTITFRSLSERIDSILTHPVWALPLFALILFIVFYSTFKLGSYPMQWIENLVSMVNSLVIRVFPDGMLKDLLTDGIISGTGSVLVFLPNIVILFLLISLLEESGYMSRAAFIMDKLMHRFGLHGRSFIPLVIGFGCNVPAIMATRALRNKNDRIVTMLIIPFMSCSARLPVYILIISAFFPSYQALYLIGIYTTGFLLAFFTSRLLGKTFFRDKETPFVMELPTYRLPSFRDVTYEMWDKTKQYLKKIGGIILIGVIIIWALEYFPTTSVRKSPGDEVRTGTETPDQPGNYQGPKEQEKINQLTNSYLGRIGSFIQPVLQPLGFDWKMSISLLAGLPAKEITVSTTGVLYHSDDGNVADLKKKLQNEIHQSGKLEGRKVFTKPAALSFLVFILIYFPCIGVVATIRNESGHWKWALFSVVYTTVLAWIAGFLVFSIGNFLF